MAVLGGIGGGVTRDVLVNRVLRDLGLTRAGTPEGGDERERVGVGHAGRQAPHDALGSWAERFISSG